MLGKKTVLFFNSKLVIIVFPFFMNLISKYDWNILFLLNSSLSFFLNTKRPARVWSVYLSQINN